MYSVSKGEVELLGRGAPACWDRGHKVASDADGLFGNTECNTNLKFRSQHRTVTFSYK
jgi:hypothetical protein